MTVSFVATNDASVFLFFFDQCFFTDFSLASTTLRNAVLNLFLMALISSTDFSFSRVVEVTERREILFRREDICSRRLVCFDSESLLVVKRERGWWVLVKVTHFSELLRI